MSDPQSIKREIYAFLDGMDESVLVSEDEKDQLKNWCDELAQHTEVPEPINQQEAAAGVWRSRFASFGARHSDNQPLRHTSNLALQSFGNLPKVTVKVTDLIQEIDVETKAYNNVVHVTNDAGTARGIVVMFGTYAGDDDNPQRYGVSFYRVAFFSDSTSGDTEFRTAFGIAEDAELDKAFKPPALHSDIVYLDSDTRINYGKLGGFYVLSRDDRPAYSLSR